MGRIDVRNLRKVFSTGDGDLVAVDDLDFTIEDGEFLVLVGPSGCGKSTTLRCIAGLERPTSGEIILDGEDVTHAKPKDRNMAMVFQSYALYPHMTARENMSFGLKMTTDMPDEEIDERVREVAEMTGIEANLDQKPGELSGGQQQRVALGRAIVRDPEVFLMDEPLSNLDAKLRSEMRTELQNLQHDFGVTTIYVTHDQTEAMTMGDRIAILNDGELQQIGTPLECYHTPANEFVAGFIGSPSMNFLDVRYQDGQLVHDEFSYDLSPEVAETLNATGSGYVLGIRPEDIHIATGDEQNTIATTVNVVEPLGDVAHVNISIGDKTYTASIDGTPNYDPGTEIQITFPEREIHLFEADSGDAVKNAAIDTDGRTADAQA
ncbi:ABC transporter ATP-binding protein [Natranaeroarchaeum sulfidigenes]|uniref:ABC-type D-xylose/L-arabinose transporter n=1 Tax=Natranaeroarchaeum sulfidigenes TaxID=2784880 RepID=A0A897MY68_9EURY|nr:ABC transporter ATP-binding protein [Natranaeroarchaeum sulfidigenes]QSG03285.1 ABC-type spermidine/putrescine transport system,ATPase component [Natranaeroarchaeum sulfidigenes]